jgi:hypothetical protein
VTFFSACSLRYLIPRSRNDPGDCPPPRRPAGTQASGESLSSPPCSSAQSTERTDPGHRTIVSLLGVVATKQSSSLE